MITYNRTHTKIQTKKCSSIYSSNNPLHSYGQLCYVLYCLFFSLLMDLIYIYTEKKTQAGKDIIKSSKLSVAQQTIDFTNLAMHKIWNNPSKSYENYSQSVEKFWNSLAFRGKWGHLWSGFWIVVNNFPPISQKLS